MNIQEIKRRVDLLKTVNNSRYCLIPELAKELKVSKTDLMQFILDNPKLFHVENQWSYKDKVIYNWVCGNRIKNTMSVKNKNLGLGIEEVYVLPEDNFRTEEWLQRQIIEKAKYIYISEFDNYGSIEGYYINIDKENNSGYREWLWRNTEYKVKSIQSLGITCKGTFYYGGFGDCTPCHVEYEIFENGLEKLNQEGWTFNELKPINRR